LDLVGNSIIHRTGRVREGKLKQRKEGRRREEGETFVSPNKHIIKKIKNTSILQQGIKQQQNNDKGGKIVDYVHITGRTSQNKENLDDSFHVIVLLFIS